MIDLMENDNKNPCLTCGACCAFYRASFYWSEADDFPSGTVPVELTERFNDFQRVMKGTHQPHPRCIALQGNVGDRVACSIYEKRSSVCRSFPVSWENGSHNHRCDKARIHWALAPVQPPVTDKPKKPPKYPRAA